MPLIIQDCIGEKSKRKLTTPSAEAKSSNPRKAGIAGGVVLMSSGNQSPLEGEFPWVKG